MISRRIPPGNNKQGQARRHDFRKLGNYCRDASHAGEKCLMSWDEGCLAPDYDLALEEIIATQAMNSRAKNDKTYHLMVSFRPDDETKLTLEDYKKIELAMAEAMGLSDHQRVCGIHKNTNNLHMHVAYNLIRPDKFTMNEPYFDQRNRDAACRALEKEFGLMVDNGIEISDPLEPKIDQRAAAMEAHSGEQSFQSFALERRQQILSEMQKAQSWSDAHQILAVHGIAIKPQANGLILANADDKGKETMKASAFDRSMSKAKLIARFGDYEQADEPKGTKAKTEDTGKTKYSKKPLHPRSPERDELYKEYQALLVEKIARIDAEKARSQAAFDGLKERWQQAKLNAGNRRVYGMMLTIQRRDMAKAKTEHQERLAAIKKDYSWHNWNGFLQSRAEGGDKVALAVLRSQEERRAANTRADKNPEPERIFLTVPFTDKSAAKDAGARWDIEKWYAPAKAKLGKFAAWMPTGDGKDPDKKSVKPSVEKTSPKIRLSRLVWQEKERMKAGVADKSHFAGFKFSIDSRGVVIISLASGGTIRDTGNKLYFSPDDGTLQAARLYAMAKFGQKFSEKDNCIKRKENGRWNRHKPHLGIFKESARSGVRTLSQIPLAFGGKQPEVLLSDHAHMDMER